MNATEVRERAFAMPLTQPAYPPGPYRFYDREFLIITYRTDREKLRELVPEPLEVVSDLVKFEFIRMPNSTGFGDYTEAGQVIPVRFRGQAGQLHALHVPQRPSADRRRTRAVGLSQEARRTHAFARKPTRWSARSTMDPSVSPPARWATSTRKLTLPRPRKSWPRPISCSRSFRTSTAARAFASWSSIISKTFKLKGVWTGPGALSLNAHALAPVAELPVLEVVFDDSPRRGPHARSRQGRPRLPGQLAVRTTRSSCGAPVKNDALANRANGSAATVQCDASGEKGRSTFAQAIGHIAERGLRAQSSGPPDRVALAEFMSRWRQLRIKRNEVLGASIFRDPAFDMLLELFATDQLGHAISVTSLCHASGVPMATAHRHLKQLKTLGCRSRRRPSRYSSLLHTADGQGDCRPPNHLQSMARGVDAPDGPSRRLPCMRHTFNSKLNRAQAITCRG